MGGKWRLALVGGLGAIIGAAIVTAVYASAHRLYAEIWGTVAQWASALGTTCAVVVAIWGDRLRRCILKPRIVLSVTKPTGDIALTQRIDSKGIPLMPVPATWLHVAVSNPTRWFPAKDAEVYLLRVERLRASVWVEEWEGPTALTWRHGSLPTRNFGPDWEADILRVIGGTLSFAARKPDPLLSNFTGPVELRVVLQARALELDSDELTIVVAWNGRATEAGGQVSARSVANPTPEQRAASKAAAVRALMADQQV